MRRQTGTRRRATVGPSAAASGVVISEPETNRGRRTLPVDPYLVQALTKFRFRCDQEATLLGAAITRADFIVVDELGAPIPPDKCSKMFRQLTARAGLLSIRLHDVRHTAHS